MASNQEYSDRPYLVVSGDAHVGPQLERDLRKYCPAKYLEQFDAFTAEHNAAVAAGQRAWSNGSFAAKPKSSSEELDTAVMSKEAREWGIAELARIIDNPGSWDPHVRLADMDGDGVTAEVIFAGAQNRQTLPWAGGNDAGSTKVDQELKVVGGRIFNEWLADFCSVSPERLLGVAQIPITDIDAAIAEVYWAKEHGLRAINLPAPRPDYPAYNENEVYDRFWSVIEEVDLPLVTHSASGEAASGSQGHGAAMLFLSEVLWLSRRGLGQLIFGAVFDRHPNLTVAFVEQRGNWVQQTLHELDSAYLGVPKNAAMPLLGAPIDMPKKTPSEYWHSNCIIADSFMAPYEAAMRHEIGLQNLMWGTDYPHLEGTWPRTHEALRNTFAGIPEAEVRAILGDNGVRVFHVDEAKVQDVVERIGPRPKDLAVPLSAEEWPVYPGLAFREAGSFH